MKKEVIRQFIFISLIIIVFSFISFNFANGFSGSGDGSAGTPYQVTNCTQLSEIKDDPSKTYTVMNNIDCSDTVNWDSGSGFLPISDFGTPFYGAFIGNGYNITNLYINRPTTDYVGLFMTGFKGPPGAVYGQFSGIGLINVSIVGKDGVGGLLGSCLNGLVTGLSQEESASHAHLDVVSLDKA